MSIWIPFKGLMWTEEHLNVYSRSKFPKGFLWTENLSCDLCGWSLNVLLWRELFLKIFCEMKGLSKFFYVHKTNLRLPVGYLWVEDFSTAILCTEGLSNSSTKRGYLEGLPWTILRSSIYRGNIKGILRKEGLFFNRFLIYKEDFSRFSTNRGYS